MIQITIEDIAKMRYGSAMSDTEFNAMLLDHLIQGTQLSRETYLEYLEITQGDLNDLLNPAGE